jgi:hypothetical protein
MSIPTVTLKDIDLLDRICIVDDSPLEIPSIFLEDFDINRHETRGYIYTRSDVVEYYERMFPKMRVRCDSQFDEQKLLTWLQKLRIKTKYQKHKHVLVLDLCFNNRQLSSLFIEKLVEAIHNFGQIIFLLTVPSSFEKHALFHKFDRIVLGQHVPNDAFLWETLGEDVRKFYSNIPKGQKFLSWNVRDGRYEILDISNYESEMYQQYENENQLKQKKQSTQSTQSNQPAQSTQSNQPAQSTTSTTKSSIKSTQNDECMIL